MLKDFFSLIYPQVCLACGKTLFKKEKCICSYCKYHLPKTNFHLDNDNPVSRMFWGRAELHSASAYYFFNKGSKVQKLLHELKYKGQKEVGTEIGKQYGYELKHSSHFSTAELVIPVPLHPKKLKKRGYNQSDFFAMGIAKAMEIELSTTNLHRTTNTSTQTKKSRFDRWMNVETIFEIHNHDAFTGKHLLLVDDVITTGSTLEACALRLLQVPGVKVSIATIACTS